MSRRRKQEDEFLGLVKGLAGLILLGSVVGIFHPHLLQTLAKIFLLILIAGLVVLTVVIILKVRRRRQRSVMSPSPRVVDLQSLSATVEEVRGPMISVAAVEPSKPNSFRPITEAELRSIDWFQFEKVIAALYESRGCRVERRGGANPDGGIDLVVYKNDKGAAVQCKHWKASKVRVRDVRDFFGGMTAEGFDRGIFVTLQGYSNEAREFAEAQNITVVDGEQIGSMLAQADAQTISEIRAIMDDSTKHCPKCGATMVIRTARRGLNFGGKFWGCSTFPRCNAKMRFEQ